MLLSDRDIRTEIHAGRLIIDPFDPQLIQPSSVDLRLDHRFRVFNSTRRTHIDPADPPADLTSLVAPRPGEPFVLHPGEFVLGSTLEHVTIPADLAGRLEGRSSRGRIGLLVHSTAGFIDPGPPAPSPWSCRTRRPCRSCCGLAWGSRNYVCSGCPVQRSTRTGLQDSGPDTRARTDQPQHYLRPAKTIGIADALTVASLVKLEPR